MDNGTYHPGDLITIDNEIDNIGEATSPPYSVDFYASTNTTITTSDTHLAYFDRPGLNAGYTHSYKTTVQLPTTLAPDDYYIGIIVTCTGDNTSNNTGYDGVPIQVILPDTAGPKVGSGIGVLGDEKNHIDTYYSDDVSMGTIAKFNLIDISRRRNTNPHNHDGQMNDDAGIITRKEIGAIWQILTDDDNIWNSVDQASGIDAHVYSGIVYDYLLSVLDLNSFDGNGNFMVSIVDITSWEDFICNAGWDGNVVGYAATCPYFLPLSGALDCVAHEWGHAVTEKAAVRGETLIYEKESGALNESFSDWLGVAVEHANNGESNWTIGEDVYLLRDLSDPTLHNDPDFYKGLYWVDVDDCIPDKVDNDWCGVHTNNGVPNKMFYLLAAGGTHHDVTVTGIGITMAMEIAYDANMYYWSPTETFAGARQGMITAADSYGQNAVEQTTNAWAAVGVGAPDLSVQAVDVDNGTYHPGDLIAIDDEIDNIGEATSPPYRVDFYASTDTTITTSDTHLNYFDRPGLNAGYTHSYKSNVQLPTTLAPDDYYIGIIVTCTGDNTNNNTGYDGVPIQVIMPEYCGDGIVNGTEQCDDDNQVNTDGCLNSCVIASCGDGFIQSGVEACDDGNTVTGDFCDANCEIDTDGDGLNDNDEINIYNTSPSNPDSDNDGLNDGVEVNILGTDPNKTDTDENGTPDGDEDSDGDGFTNAEEIICDSDPGNPNSKCMRGMPWLMLLLDDEIIIPLNSPANLTVSNPSSSTIILNWTDTSKNEIGFRIYMATAEFGTYSYVESVGDNITTHVVSGLPPSTTYWFKVTAYTTGGESDFSNIVSVTTPRFELIKWDSNTGGNDHYYEIFVDSSGKTWQEMYDHAISQGGYLATITSYAENEFIFSLIDDPSVWFIDRYDFYRGPTIGGIQAPGAVEPDGSWGWITGEEFVFSSWASIQPNNSGDQDRIEFWNESSIAPTWQDVSAMPDELGISWVVEYNASPGDQAD